VPLDLDQRVVVARALVRFRPDGTAALNRPGGACWPLATPVLQADDVVRITTPGGMEETTVANVTCLRPRLVEGDVVVNGNANTGKTNQPLPPGSLEQALELPLGFYANDEKALTATAAGADGRLAYDTPVPVNPGDWTATYHGLASRDQEKALYATSRITWRSPGGNEATVFELPDDPALGAALQPGCPAGLLNMITDTDHATITPENQGQDFAFTGVAAPEVTQVDVSVNDGPPATVVLPATLAPKAWHLVVPAAKVPQTRGNGPFTAFATFTAPALAPIVLGGNPPPQATFKLRLPQAASMAPAQATPQGGALAVPTRVELSAVDPAAVVLYTLDGTDPSPASAVYQGVPLPIDHTTTLKYRTMLPDGTLGPVQADAYVFAAQAPVRADPPGGTYAISQFVNLVLNAPGTLRYTLDGSDPTPSSPMANAAPVLITSPTTLRYRAWFPDGSLSPVMVDRYTIVDTHAPVLSSHPFATFPAVAKCGPLPVVQLFATEQATVRFTTNGATPTDASPVYPVGGIVLTSAMLNTNNPARTRAATLKAVATDLAGRRSDVFTLIVRP
jgi:hypothetical protein